MKNKLLTAYFLIVCNGAHAQNYQWTSTNTPTVGFRFEDVFFLNPDTGFAVHYPEAAALGLIIKTIDGGITWNAVWDSSIVQFRDIGFTDALHGWVGTLGHSNDDADTNRIYQTVDGGTTWNGVPNFPGPDSSGICGLRVINRSTIYAIGRYEGHAGFYKTTDNGLHWSYNNLDSLAQGLVDIFFLNEDTGFAVGTSGPNYFTGSGRVLYTTDAGDTWSMVHTSTHKGTIGWKVVFPSREIGYCSLEAFNSSSQEYFLKTTDGGHSWQDILFVGGPSNSYDVEGIGFINDTVGWVGGSTHTYFTQNGGLSWIQQTWGDNINRFRFFSDSLAYAAGQKIYKMTISPTGINTMPNMITLNSYPNPAKDYAYFEFFVYKPVDAKLIIYDMQGNQVALVFNKKFNYGNQHFTWQPKNLSPGTYMCKLICGDEVAVENLKLRGDHNTYNFDQDIDQAKRIRALLKDKNKGALLPLNLSLPFIVSLCRSLRAY